MESTTELKMMINAVRKAAIQVMNDFKNVSDLRISPKGVDDYVTSADINAEHLLRSELAKGRPDFGFLCEEGGETKGRDGDNIYIIDPIDGTLNFMRGVPFFAITVALERRGEIVAGVTFNPVSNELFHASKGAGAFCNDRRVHVGTKSSLNECLLFYDLPNVTHVDYQTRCNEVSSVRSTGASMRSLGSTALELAYTAMGSFDGGWMRGIWPWDMAAGLIILREAGGLARGIKGEDNPLRTGGYICGNQVICPELIKSLAGC